MSNVKVEAVFNSKAKKVPFRCLGAPPLRMHTSRGTVFHTAEFGGPYCGSCLMALNHQQEVERNREE